MTNFSPHPSPTFRKCTGEIPHPWQNLLSVNMTFSLPRSPLTLLLRLAPFFFWGTAMVAMRGTVPHLSPLLLATLRLWPAGILVLLAAHLSGRSQPQGWVPWLWIGGFALVDGTLFQGFLAEGLFHTGAGLGSVMIDSQPLMVALLALWLFREPIGLWGWLGLGLGAGGIALLGLPEPWIWAGLYRLMESMGDLLGPWSPFPAVTDTPLGMLGSGWGGSGEWGTAPIAPGIDPVTQGQGLMLLAALAMAWGTVLSRYVSRHCDPVVATGWHMILGGIPLALGSWLTEAPDLGRLDWGDWGALAYATVFGTAIAYALFFHAAAQGSLTSLSALTFLTPVFALLFGHLLLHEVLSSLQWGGVGLTLVSIYLINQREVLGHGGSPGNF